MVCLHVHSAPSFITFELFKLAVIRVHSSAFLFRTAYRVSSSAYTMASLSASIVLGLLVGSAFGVNNGLARTPQMGWVSSYLPFLILFGTDTPQNNWNSLGCDVSDSLLLETSSKLVSSGLRDVGYTYVVLDDCWSTGRRESDQWLVADPKKFPRGMKAVADDVHNLGLLFGMYSSAGEMTCARFGKSLSRPKPDAVLS